MCGTYTATFAHLLLSGFVCACVCECVRARIFVCLCLFRSCAYPDRAASERAFSASCVGCRKFKFSIIYCLEETSQLTAASFTRKTPTNVFAGAGQRKGGRVRLLRTVTLPGQQLATHLSSRQSTGTSPNRDTANTWVPCKPRATLADPTASLVQEFYLSTHVGVGATRASV